MKEIKTKPNPINCKFWLDYLITEAIRKELEAIRDKTKCVYDHDKGGFVIDPGFHLGHKHLTELETDRLFDLEFRLHKAKKRIEAIKKEIVKKWEAEFIKVCSL